MQDLFEVFDGILGEGVSDIYVHSDAPLIYKLHGALKSAQSITQAQVQAFIARYFSHKASEALFDGVEQDVSLEHGGYFFRVHGFLAQNAPALVFRILPQKTRQILDYKELDALKPLLSSRGLLLIVGATGSGKTTTANAILEYINTHFSKHIVCIEDPIEYKHANQKSIFTYREVAQDTKSFHSGIMSAMRQDPDVIFIGELREPEAILSALLAAQTGHLVLATLHADNATSALMRLLNADKSKLDEIAESLLGVIAQQRVGSAEMRGNALGERGVEMGGDSAGCDLAKGRLASGDLVNGVGSTGGKATRVEGESDSMKGESRGVIFEVMLANSAIKTLIKEQKFHQIQNQIFLSQNEGMVSFAQSLELAKARGGGA